MIPFMVMVLVSFATLVLGFEAGKSYGYAQAKSIMITLIETVMKIHEKEKTNE